MSNRSGSFDFGLDNYSCIRATDSRDRALSNACWRVSTRLMISDDGEGERTTTMTAVADGWRDVIETSRVSRQPSGRPYKTMLACSSGSREQLPRGRSIIGMLGPRAPFGRGRRAAAAMRAACLATITGGRRVAATTFAARRCRIIASRRNING